MLKRALNKLLFTFTLIAVPNLVYAKDFYFGADLSYVNEMEDCGAKYSYNGITDAYKIFAASGHNLIRVRLWNDAEWTKYSNFIDVVETIKRSKAEGMEVLLDFHYSDEWADGEKQIVPKAWANLSDEEQAKKLYEYTYDTLNKLNEMGLMPEMVQVGNETNGEVLQTLENAKNPINWKRNALLLNSGLKAVRDISKKTSIKPKIMLHIAQPENIDWWFTNAIKNGITDFDIIGISYYKKWSKYDLKQFAETIKSSKEKFKKEIIIVETSYPYTTDHKDNNVNLMGADSSFKEFGVSIKGQYNYMKWMTQTIIDNGGIGLVYWEPAWVSTNCKTRWGTGSNWENATFFDFDGKAIKAIEWPKIKYNF